MSLSSRTTGKANGYAPVNGLQMYHEIDGTGDPLLCIPPAFGFAGLNPYPALAQSHTVITVDLQGHGRTADGKPDWQHRSRKIADNLKSRTRAEELPRKA